MPQVLVAPSILSADFCNLQADCEKLFESGADWLHIDVMDGHFVPNISLGIPVIKSLRSKFPSKFLDCHLMIENPELWVERVYGAGASSITFHFEASTDPLALVERIKSFTRADSKFVSGVAVKPDTPISDLSDELLEAVDMILVMTVEPGFGGQKLIPSCINKVSELRQVRGFQKLIQVDGGIDKNNVDELKIAGANVLVAGSSIFNSSDPFETIKHFHQ